MAQINWLGFSANWVKAPDWDTHTVPGAGDDAILGGTGTYSVGLTTAVTVDSITISDFSATLSIHAAGLVDTVTGDLSNDGNVTVDNGLREGGTTLNIEGTLTNSRFFAAGNPLNKGGPTTITAAHFVNDGILVLDQASLITGDDAPAMLASGSEIKIFAGSLLEYAGGSIGSVAAGAALEVAGLLADSSDPASDGALAGLASNAGTVDFSDQSVQMAGSLSNSGFFDIDGHDSPFSNAGGSTVGIGGTLTNSGVLSIGYAGNQATTVSVGHFINTGSLAIEGSVGRASLVDLGDAAPGTLASGITLDVTSNALLEYARGGIDTIAAGASLLVWGADARIAVQGDLSENSALTGLRSNAGSLSVESGAVLTDNVAVFSNSGSLLLDFATINAGGTFRNSGRLDVIDATMTVAHLSNTASIVVKGDVSKNFEPLQSTLLDTGDSAPSKIATGVSYDLEDDALLEFASGGIATIEAGGSLTLASATTRLANASDTTTSSALLALTKNAGSLALIDGGTLSTAGSLLNSGTIGIDADTMRSGSLLAVGGTLNNTGTLDAGSEEIHNRALVTASGLKNNGTIDLEGGSSTHAGMLQIIGTVTNTGTLDIGTYGAITQVSTFLQTAGDTELSGILNAARVNVAGGLLEGTGTVIGKLDISTGDLAAGSFSNGVTGTLAVEGTLKLHAGGTIEAVLGDAGAASDVDVSGKVFLKGGTLALDVAGTLAAGETFTILQFAPGELSGKFTAITDGVHTGNGDSLDLGNGLTLDASYDDAGGMMTLAAVATPAGAAASFSQQGNDTALSIQPDGTVTHHDGFAMAVPVEASFVQPAPDLL